MEGELEGAEDEGVGRAVHPSGVPHPTQSPILTSNLAGPQGLLPEARAPDDTPK
mgnify:CR=1 FL=1